MIGGIPMGGYQPEWTKAIETYTLKYLRLNEWRVRPFLELDDMLHEMYLVFLEASTREFKDEAHFRGYWKTCLHNSVHRWAGKRTRRLLIESCSLNDIDPVLRASDDGNNRWRHKVATTVGPVRRLLKAVGRRRPKRRRLDGTRLTTNQYLCEYAGLPSDVPLRELFEAWLDEG
jgi:DNA-directed RNA polymerase specialized sigma24 family protein